MHDIYIYIYHICMKSTNDKCRMQQSCSRVMQVSPPLWKTTKQRGCSFKSTSNKRAIFHLGVPSHAFDWSLGCRDHSDSLPVVPSPKNWIIWDHHAILIHRFRDGTCQRFETSNRKWTYCCRDSSLTKSHILACWDDRCFNPVLTFLQHQVFVAQTYKTLHLLSNKYNTSCGGFHQCGYPKCMVYSGKSQSNMDDLGVLPF